MPNVKLENNSFGASAAVTIPLDVFSMTATAAASIASSPTAPTVRGSRLSHDGGGVGGGDDEAVTKALTSQKTRRHPPKQQRPRSHVGDVHPTQRPGYAAAAGGIIADDTGSSSRNAHDIHDEERKKRHDHRLFREYPASVPPSSSTGGGGGGSKSSSRRAARVAGQPPSKKRKHNGPMRKNTSAAVSTATKYIGVTYSKSRDQWQSRVCISHQQRYCGRYRLAADAARAYDLELSKLNLMREPNFRSEEQYLKARRKEERSKMAAAGAAGDAARAYDLEPEKLNLLRDPNFRSEEQSLKAWRKEERMKKAAAAGAMGSIGSAPNRWKKPANSLVAKFAEATNQEEMVAAIEGAHQCKDSTCKLCPQEVLPAARQHKSWECPLLSEVVLANKWAEQNPKEARMILQNNTQFMTTQYIYQARAAQRTSDRAREERHVNTLDDEAEDERRGTSSPVVVGEVGADIEAEGDGGEMPVVSPSPVKPRDENERDALIAASVARQLGVSGSIV